MTQTSASLAADPLDSLLEKLGQGDPDAAEEVFRAYEPYLRLVVRRQLSENLRAKFDSMDIVQSVWADVLVGFRRAAWNFQDAAHLKAFLVRVAKHRLIDRFRQHHRAIEHERSFNSAELEAFSEPEASRPSAEVHADELWQQVRGSLGAEEVFAVSSATAASPGRSFFLVGTFSVGVSTAVFTS